jgi:hypothetical protein
MPIDPDDWGKTKEYLSSLTEDDFLRMTSSEHLGLMWPLTMMAWGINPNDPIPEENRKIVRVSHFPDS